MLGWELRGVRVAGHEVIVQAVTERRLRRTSNIPVSQTDPVTRPEDGVRSVFVGASPACPGITMVNSAP